MPDCLKPVLEREECSRAITSLFELVEGDMDIFWKLQEKGECTTRELAESFDKDPSTIYRALKRLQRSSFVERKKVLMDGGGYHYIYRALESETLRSLVEASIEKWYRHMRKVIELLEAPESDTDA